MRIRLLCLLAALVQGAPAFGQERGVFTDPEDGKFDASEWLLEKKGFLPVPILITEPAVGYGAGVAFMFFRESIGEAVEHGKQTGHVTPPDVFGAIVAGTENGTTFLGAGGMFSFDQDRWRYRGFIGKPHVNLEFYGQSGNLGTGEQKVAYNLDGWVSSQQVLRRLGDSNHYLALRWIYMDLTSRFEPGHPVPPPFGQEQRLTSSGVGPSWEWDTRDNIFTPSRGFKTALDMLVYRPSLGGDESFEIYRAYLFNYVPVAQPLVLGMRLDSRAARGDVPFYQLPFIEMRGIPMTRYQGENVGVAEAELRWNVTPRWAAIGFLGAGRAWGGQTGFSDAPTQVSWGAGVRYQIARKLGLYVGLDVAKGPEEEAIYIQMGSAWR